jgi:uncharacterized protein involved in exopolysaccharide biosynthesis
MVVNMVSMKQARKERTALERQASALFRALLKAERGRSGPLVPPRERQALAKRVAVIDGEIRKIRRALRKIGVGR